MPRRWLSVRGQRETKNAVHVVQDDFDFDFTGTSQHSVPSASLCKTDANMFNASFKSRMKNSSSRPHTADGPRYVTDKRLHLTKVEDNWIGVAFGSPTHPPTSLPGLPLDDSPQSSRDVFRDEGSSPPLPSQISKYKKLGNLFKSKATPLAISAPTNVYRIDGEQKPGTSIARKPCPNQHLLPQWLNSEHTDASTPSVPVLEQNISCETSELTQKSQKGSLLKLEIQIPSIEMDRYSVMFGNVSGVQPSNLLERRRKSLSDQKQNDTIHNDNPSIPTVQPQPFHPPVTPDQHHRKSSTYSLFPGQTRSRAKVCESSDRSLPSRQLSYSSKTSLATDISSIQSDGGHVESQYTRGTPQQTKSDAAFPTPEGTVASSEREFSPWRSDDSLRSTASSQTSVGSEIFFNIKPARDAEGRESSQYIIQQPDSPAIELAVSNSRRAKKARNKKLEEEYAMFNTGPDLQAAEFMLQAEEKWRLSMELNQAIAEVERLTSPTKPLLASTNVAKSTPAMPGPPPAGSLPGLKLRKRLDGLAIGIPSPISERSEIISPRPSPIKNANSNNRSHIASLSIKPAPLNMSNEPSPAVTEFDLTPPPVPIKDAKFVPISKFAAKNSLVQTVEYSRRRRKPQRSVTEGSTIPMHTPCSSTTQAAKRDRPATLTNTVDLSVQRLPSTRYSRKPEIGGPTTTSRSTAEVSVARTVSLSRKQSQQILVSRTGVTLSPDMSKSPTIHEGRGAHQHGASFNVVVEQIAR